MVLPDTIPNFSLNITPQKLNALTQEIINSLQGAVQDIIERSENKNANKLDLLKSWHKAEGLAAEQQTFCTLPSYVRKKIINIICLYIYIYKFTLIFFFFFFKKKKKK